MWRLAVFCVGVCLSLPASAAKLDAIEGQVLINHGAGFKTAADATEVRQGDLVMANPGGSAKLVYPGGCVTEIKPGKVATVGDGSHCPKAMLLGGEREDCKRDDNDPKDLRPRCGFVWWPYAAVAAGVALPLAGFLISTADDDDNGRGRPFNP